MDFCGDGGDISPRLHVQLILLVQDSHPVHEHIAYAFDYTIQQCSDYLRNLSSKLFVSLSSRNVRNFLLFKTRAPRNSTNSISSAIIRSKMLEIDRIVSSGSLSAARNFAILVCPLDGAILSAGVNASFAFGIHTSAYNASLIVFNDMTSNTFLAEMVLNSLGQLEASLAGECAQRSDFGSLPGRQDSPLVERRSYDHMDMTWMQLFLVVAPFWIPLAAPVIKLIGRRYLRKSTVKKKTE